MSCHRLRRVTLGIAGAALTPVVTRLKLGGVQAKVSEMGLKLECGTLKCRGELAMNPA